MTRSTPTTFLRETVAAATVTAFLIGSGIPAVAADSSQRETTVPAKLQSKLETLTPAQRKFINDPANLHRFDLTKEKLYNQLGRRDAAGVQAYVSALMDTVEAAKFDPGQGQPGPDSDRSQLNPAGDMAEIPLNPQAGNFNARTVLRPEVLDQYEREAGPFSLHRYVNQTDGIPTFANAPVALRKEDLVVGDVEVAFAGVPLGFSSGWRDAQNAPKVLRAMYGLDGYDTYGGIDPSLELAIADYGNIAVDYMSVERSIDHTRKMVGKIPDTGAIPFIVGGDHAVMFPTVAAMVDNYGQGNVGVLHMDAHFNGQRNLAHRFSDRQSVARLLEEDLIDGKNLVQVGLRGPEPDAESLSWMRSEGIRYHTMAEVEQDGWDAVMSEAIEEAKDGPKNIFISFDISVLDPAYARGAGRPVPGGLTMREALPLVRRVCAETNVVGFEMLDVAPYLDRSYQTALNANYIMHACLTGLALRKNGLTNESYLKPIAADHGQ